MRIDESWLEHDSGEGDEIDPLAIEVEASASFNNTFVTVEKLDNFVRAHTRPKMVKRSNSFIRAHDLNISGHELQMDDERTDRDTSDCANGSMVCVDRNGQLVMNGLVEIGLAEAIDESSRWVATSSTASVLNKRVSSKRRSKTGMGPWKNAAHGKDVLVWSSKCFRPGHGEEYPVVKARGLIFASAKEVVDLLTDSRRVGLYNRSSLGRKDKFLLATNSLDSEAKIMSSLTKPPIVRKPLECLTLFHARQLTKGDNVELDGNGKGFVTVGRSVWENEEGEPDGSNSTTIRCEILLSVNLVRDVSTADGSRLCELTIITHAVSPAGIPLFIGKKAALTAADGFIKDVRAVFEK